ncbi:MAG: potassium transporter Kup [Janthinobacterium lividum]
MAETETTFTPARAANPGHPTLPAVAHSRGKPIGLALAALGIVYGDIGTSPLYAFKQAVQAGGTVSQASILGVLSLIVWALVVVVSVKYAVLIMRADNHGEGGVVAMLALLDVSHAPPGSWRAALLVVGLIGAALLYGDGVITPAISVLSAIEGLKLDAPGITHYVVPITLAILAGLFLVQRRGTEAIGRVFGPVMLLWFAAIGALGLVAILRAPGVLAALNPLHALGYLVHAGPGVSFAVLGAAFLAVTGGEAMYADMGHFGRLPIRMGWFAVALPCLVLNYFGQGALLLGDAQAIENPFYLMAPGWAHYPLVLFATLATIIASQAIISGAFSLTQQSIQLGFLPRMRVLHTATREVGQIYIPLVNWLLAAGTVTAVLVFRSSDALGGAYGIAVSLLMVITTVLAGLIALSWGFNPLLVMAVNGTFLLIDLVFFAANGTKLLEGGWFPLLIAAAVAFLMLTWRSGAMLLTRAHDRVRCTEAALNEMLRADPPIRLPGTAAVFGSATGVPMALMQHLRHNHVLHQRVLLLSTLTAVMPHVPEGERAEITALEYGLTRVVLQFGFMERPDVPAALRQLAGEPAMQGIDPDDITYYLRRETVVPTRQEGTMRPWRKALFGTMLLNAHRSATYYGLPLAKVIEVGIEVEI